MGVIWREFGDGVSMSERYLRMWMGLLSVLESLLFVVEGSSGGVRLALLLTAKFSDSISFSSKTFSKMNKGTKV